MKRFVFFALAAGLFGPSVSGVGAEPHAAAVGPRSARGQLAEPHFPGLRFARAEDPRIERAGIQPGAAVRTPIATTVPVGMHDVIPIDHSRSQYGERDTANSSPVHPEVPRNFSQRAAGAVRIPSSWTPTATLARATTAFRRDDLPLDTSKLLSGAQTTSALNSDKPERPQTLNPLSVVSAVSSTFQRTPTAAPINSPLVGVRNAPFAETVWRKWGEKRVN